MAVKSGSVERLVGSYNAWATNGAAQAPAWLKDLRASGIARFGDLGFPDMKQEAWRFTSVAPIAEGSFALAKPPVRIPALDDIRPFLLLEAGYRLVFVDGFFQRSLSTPFFDDVQSLAHVVTHRQDLVRQYLGKYAAMQDRPFSALNTAFMSEGAFVHVPAKATLAEPIQLQPRLVNLVLDADRCFLGSEYLKELKGPVFEIEGGGLTKIQGGSSSKR